MDSFAKEWKEFKLNEVFDVIEPSKGNTTYNLVEGNEIPYIAAKKNNNGIQKMVAREGNEQYISKGNCIVFIHIGDGSGGYSLYQPNDFIGMSGKTSCGYSNNLNKYNALFIVTILDKGRYKYCFGRSWTGERFKQTTLSLPSKNGKPDWEYMTDFIKKRYSLKLNKIKTANVNPLTLKAPMEEFKMSDLFKVKSYKSISKTNVSLKGNGDYPYITRTALNNGISGYYNYKNVPKNTITIETTLSGLCFYHDYEYSTGDHIMVLNPINGTKLNKYTAIYIKTIWRKNAYKYSYGRPALKENIDNTYLLLPSKNGKPDWEYMESFIKSLPYADRI